MLVSKPAWFSVVAKRHGDVWLEVISGGDKGRCISVPVHDSRYDLEVEHTLENVRVGDECELTLCSASEEAPSWVIDDVLDVQK